MLSFLILAEKISNFSIVSDFLNINKVKFKFANSERVALGQSAFVGGKAKQVFFSPHWLNVI